MSARAERYRWMGGLVAYDFGCNKITSCYFLGQDNGLGTKLSDEQMKKRESFVGWDFEDEPVWKIAEDEEYPRLWWERNSEN